MAAYQEPSDKTRGAGLLLLLVPRTVPLTPRSDPFGSLIDTAMLVRRSWWSGCRLQRNRPRFLHRKEDDRKFGNQFHIQRRFDSYVRPIRRSDSIFIFTKVRREKKIRQSEGRSRVRPEIRKNFVFVEILRVKRHISCDIQKLATWLECRNSVLK